MGSVTTESGKKVLTMAEYIERKQLIGSLEDVIADYRDEHTFSTDFAATVVTDILNNIVKCQPAADVAPVRHGQWVLLDECYNEGVYCSACHKKVYKKCYANKKIKSKFCPHCGAKMDGGAENG